MARYRAGGPGGDPPQGRRAHPRAPSITLARIATLEQGKILIEAKGEAMFAAALLEFHAGEAVRIYGRVLPRPVGSRSLVLRQLRQGRWRPSARGTSRS